MAAMMSRSPSDEELGASAISELTTDECWDLLLTGLGRLATSVDGVVDIFPVNYFAHQRTILFRSAPGSKLMNITSAPEVAFEIDGVDGQFHWSVVIHGTAKRLGSDIEIIESGVKQLVSWSPTHKFNYVQITPTGVTGRRIDRTVFPHLSVGDRPSRT